ncbi:MAG TPA: glycosyltransferase [Acidiphilium sp.]
MRAFCFGKPRQADRARPDLRILLVLLSAGFAGTERHAVELANGLCDHADVAMVLRKRPSEPHRHAEYDALRRAIDPRITIFESRRAIPHSGVLRAILKFRPRIIHAHYERSARVAAFCARFFGVPVVATIHVHYRERDFGRCAALVALTEAENRRAGTAFPREIAVIGNWVIPPPVRRKSAPGEHQANRARFGIGPAEFVVGSIGRLAPVKSIDGLISAFAAAGLPDARLVIVGDGSERPRLEALAETLGLGDRVCFTGFTEDVWSAYSLFDVFVLNSRDEPFGLVILEALAMGVPVIATATDGACAIAERLPVTLIPPNSPEALVRALRTAATGSRAGTPATDCSGFLLADRLPELIALYHRVMHRVLPV